MTRLVESVGCLHAKGGQIDQFPSLTFVWYIFDKPMQWDSKATYHTLESNLRSY